MRMCEGAHSALEVLPCGAKEDSEEMLVVCVRHRQSFARSLSCGCHAEIFCERETLECVVSAN